MSKAAAFPTSPRGEMTSQLHSEQLLSSDSIYTQDHQVFFFYWSVSKVQFQLTSVSAVIMQSIQECPLVRSPWPDMGKIINISFPRNNLFVRTK